MTVTNYTRIIHKQFRSTLKLALRKRTLSATFRTLYQDLLKAVVADSYESLETICEESLLVELAARMYELEKYKGVQFRLIPSPNIDIEVINHFFVRNASVSRSSNPSLKSYKMVMKSKNLLEFTPKESDTVDDQLDYQVLEILQSVKPKYQQQQGTSDMLKEAEERNKFERSQFVRKETDKAFAEVMKHEYRLLSMYKPQALASNFEEFLAETREKERTAQVTVERGRLSKDDGYLDQLKEQFGKEGEGGMVPQILSQKMYIEAEKEKTDMFLFMRLFCPRLYDKYIRTTSSGHSEQALNLQGIGRSEGVATRFSKLFRPVVKKKGGMPNEGKVIEVFDVLIRTQHRLQLFHLKTGRDYLTLPEVGYLEKMDGLFKKQEDDGGVYVLEVDKSVYDVREPGYTQVHCLRFEQESGGAFKITDIDYWLEGNRHAKASSDELFTQAKK